jgi:hypothetical protein
MKLMRSLKNYNLMIIVGGRLLNLGISFVFRGDSSLSMGRAPSRFVTAFLQGLGLSRSSHRSRAIASPNQLNIRFQINKPLFNLEKLYFFSAHEINKGSYFEKIYSSFYQSLEQNRIKKE